MYVLLDADITKIGFKYMDKKNIEHVLNHFNADANFREDIRHIAKNVNRIISRTVKEFPEQVPYAHDFDIILVPVTNAVSVAVDYRAILDIFGTVANAIINLENVDINESFEMANVDIDLSLEMIIKFSKGFSIKESYDSVNEKYLNTNFHSNSVVNIQN